MAYRIKDTYDETLEGLSKATGIDIENIDGVVAALEEIERIKAQERTEQSESKESEYGMDELKAQNTLDSEQIDDKEEYNIKQTDEELNYFNEDKDNEYEDKEYDR